MGQRGKREGASPTVRLCCCLFFFPSEAQCPWYRCWDFMCGWSIFIAFQTHCSLWIMAGDRHWVAVKTLKLVCTKQRLEECLAAIADARLGFQASHIGHVVVSEMCRNYMWLWARRVSCGGRGGHTRLAHMSAPKARKKKKRKREAAWVTSAVDWAVEPVCGWQS